MATTVPSASTSPYNRALLCQPLHPLPRPPTSLPPDYIIDTARLPDLEAALTSTAAQADLTAIQARREARRSSLPAAAEGYGPLFSGSGSSPNQPSTQPAPVDSVMQFAGGVIASCGIV